MPPSPLPSSADVVIVGAGLADLACARVTSSAGLHTVALERTARRQLGGWFGGSVQRWELVRADRIAHGQPLARPPFHPKQTVRLGDGRYVTGDRRDTPSIQGALCSGRRCGEAVVADLTAG